MTNLQMAEQIRKALQIFAQTLTNDDAMIVASVYPAWSIGIPVKANEIYAFGTNEVGDPQLYRCLQSHTTQSDWTPDVAVSLWSAIGIGGDGIPVWSQPAGAADAYNTGDKVHYPDAEGDVYESLIDGNVWSPEVYPAGWEKK